MSRTPLDYENQFYALLPQGIIFERDPEREFHNFVEAVAQEPSRQDSDVDTFIDNVFPQTTTDFITDWEAQVGIPNECFAIDPEINIRRRNILAIFRVKGSLAVQHYIDLAATIGYTITITEFEGSRACDFRACEPLVCGNFCCTWQVNGLVSQAPHDRLECAMIKYKPGHTKVIFSYS